MKKLILLLMVLSLVGSTIAADLRYMGSGNYMDGSKWTIDNVTPYGLPLTGDTIRANWGGATISLNNPAPNQIRRFQLGVDESGTLEINSGGSLTTWDGSKVGNNNACTGTLLVNAGGTVQVNNWLMVGGGTGGTTGVMTVSGTVGMTGHLWAATQYASSAIIDINDGGVVNVGGMLGLGTVNASTPSGGIATLNVNEGGLLNLAQIHGGGTSVMPGSIIMINGSGVITKTSNFVGVMEAYAAAGYLTSDLGGILATYDDLTNLTTVVAAVPEPATMILLGLGGMLIRRKK